MFGFKNLGFWLSPEVLEGLGSSGRLVGSISTYPGTCQCPWSRVMTKNPRGEFFRPGTVSSLDRPNCIGSMFETKKVSNPSL